MKRRLGDILFDIINFVCMIAVLCVMLYPFIYIISYSLSDPAKMQGGLLFYPHGLNVVSYVECLQINDLLNGMFISVARTVIGPLTMLLFCSMAAYALSRNDMMFVKFFRKFFLFTMYFSGGIIPTYLLIKGLHLTNSFWVYIIPCIVSVFNMILIRTYIEGLPGELQDAAIVDGANDVVLFFRVILPLCTPVLAAVILFTAIGQWNSYVDTAMYNSMRRDLYPMQYLLYSFLASTQNFRLEDLQSMPWTTVKPDSKGITMAITVITMVPIACVYPFMRKYFISGLLIGAIKG